MIVTAVATTFSVPRKTLDDRVKGLVVHGKKPGVSTVLTPKEDASLVPYVILVYMAKRGFPLTRTMVKAFAFKKTLVEMAAFILSLVLVNIGGFCLRNVIPFLP